MPEILSIFDDNHTSAIRAAQFLSEGKLVALPTETVYGLAGDSTSPEAVKAIYDAKKRPHFNPLISHVSGIEMAMDYAEFDDVSAMLAQHFWPGPLTLVVPLKPRNEIDPASTAGLPTVAMRAPIGVANDVISLLERPIALPSANTSGRISPTKAQHVADDLGNKVHLILDAGPCLHGIESTVVTVRNEKIMILRHGVITPDDLSALVGTEVTGTSPTSDTAPTSPGQLSSHYAPRARVRLNADKVDEGEVLLTFGGKTVPGIQTARLTLDLSPTGSLSEAAHNLYNALMQADETKPSSIAIVEIPEHGIGLAINDRLKRAAAPR